MSSIAWGAPCRKNPDHVERLGTRRYRNGKNNCIICERDRIIALVSKRRLAAPGRSHREHLDRHWWDEAARAWTIK